MSTLLILTSCTKFELNSLRINGVTRKLLEIITDVFGSHDIVKVRNDVILLKTMVMTS